nr:gliding motility-associated C-terminal domain-containing protein [uncultured Fluviicola sp.]
MIIKQNPLHQTIWCKTITFPPAASNVVFISFMDLLGDTIFGCGSIEQNYQVVGNFYFKMNAQTGTFYWSKYETASEGYLSIMRYANGKYFLTGGTEISNSMTQAKVLAVSSQTGNVIWQTPLLKFVYTPAGNNSRTYVTAATEMLHGKMFLTGQHLQTLSSGIYPDMPFLIGITETGNVFLQHRIPLPNNGFNTSFQGSRIEYDMDENLILSCYNNGPMSTLNDPNVVLIKLDTLGNILFSKEYEVTSDGFIFVHAMNETAGSYVLCGALNTIFIGLYTLKLDKNGELQKCVGIQKPNIYYGSGSPYNAYGNSEFRNGIHYFPNTEYNASDANINNIILDEDLNFIQDCADINEVPVTITPLTIQLEPLVLTQIPNTFVYQDGIIAGDLPMYVSCDSLSLSLQQSSGCQASVIAETSGFQVPQFFWSNGTVSFSDTLLVSSTDTIIVRVLDIRCCELTDTIIPVLFSNLAVSLPADTSLCLQSGQTFLLTPQVSNPSGTVSYLWSTNSTAASLFVTSSGTYWVEISDGCISLRDSIQVTMLSAPEITGLADTAICEGTFPVNLNPIITNGVSVLWNDGVITPSRSIAGPGIYSLQVINECGTRDTTIEVLQTDLPAVSLVPIIDSCLQTGASITLNPVLNDVGFFNWSTGVTSILLTVSTSGTYTFYGWNACGIDSASCSVTVREFPELNLPETLDTCFEIGLGFSYTVQGNSGSYQWNSGSQTATEQIAQEGVYICTLTNGCGTTSDSMAVSRLADLDLYFPNDSVELCAEQISLNLLHIETNYAYELYLPWSGKPAGSNLNESGWYQIRAYNACGELWDSIYLDLRKEQAIFMPNSFTPDNDGTNDQLEITTLNATISSLRIFNRWGEEIYHLQKESQSEEIPTAIWNGSFHGQVCPDGMYVVQIIYENCFGIPTQFTGHVILLR